MKGDVFMKYASIRDMDVVNGIGIACSLFVQGCTHHCYNCFNQETWDFKKGKIFQTLECFKGYVNTMLLLDDGRLITGANEIIIWI